MITAQEIADELLVFESDSGQAYLFNSRAREVYQASIDAGSTKVESFRKTIENSSLFEKISRRKFLSQSATAAALMVALPLPAAAGSCILNGNNSCTMADAIACCSCSNNMNSAQCATNRCTNRYFFPIGTGANPCAGGIHPATLSGQLCRNLNNMDTDIDCSTAVANAVPNEAGTMCRYFCCG